MSGNVGRRLLATIYRSTSPIFAAAFRSTPLPVLEGILQKVRARPRLTAAFNPPPKSAKHVISRSFASGGFFAIGTSPSSPAAETVASTCASAAEKSSGSVTRTLDRRKATSLLHTAKQRKFHSSSRRRDPGESKDGKSSKAGQHDHEVKAERNKIAGDKGSVNDKANQSATKGLGAVSAVNKHVLERLPHMPHMPHIHRPNKEELLAAATGFWSRLKVRFKWFSIRSVRPFNVDEIGAFFSWFVLGHVIWIILGTTTFFSLAIFAINTVFAQGNLPVCAGFLAQADMPDRNIGQMGG